MYEGRARMCTKAKLYSTLMHTVDALVESTDEGRTWPR